MRKLCEYELNTRRLCKNYKFSDTYCYIHNNIISYTYVISGLFELIVYFFLPTLVVFNLFIFINYYIIIYLEQSSLYNDIFELDEILI